MNFRQYKYQLVFKQLLLFFAFLYQRVRHDRLNVSSGYMAYISLLSLVPLVTVLLTLMATFTHSSEVGLKIQHLVIDNFVPTASDAVIKYLDQFIQNSQKMGTIGGLFLFLAAMSLMSSIDKSINFIFRVQKHRRFIISFSIYWMLITLGPFLMSISFAINIEFDKEQNSFVAMIYQQAIYYLPFLLELILFTLLYMVVPNKQVKFKHALLGSLFATTFFELGKYGFVSYLSEFSSYQMIYGALAIVPLLFLWTHYCWYIILLGAEMTASLNERQHWQVNIQTDLFINNKIEQDDDSINTASH
jgi:membrane protein